MRAKLLFSVLLAAALGTGCGRKPQPAPEHPAVSTKPGQIVLPPDSPKLQQIRVDVVKTATVPADEVTSPGKLEANANRLSHVVLPVPGRIATVTVKLGDAVHQGDMLLEVESPDVDAAMAAYLQAEAVVIQTKAGLVKAQADLDRERDLFENNAVAKKEVLNAESVLAQSVAAAEQAQATREQALRRVKILGLKPGEFGQKLAVRAPISGKLLEMSVVPGEYRNDTSAPVMTIADLSTVWVTSDVSEGSIRLVQPGERFELELTAYPGEKFLARVTRIADMVDPQTRTVKVRAELDNRQGRLRPEMFGRIRLVDALEVRPVIPAAAVIQGDGQNLVFREIARGVFQQTPVTLGGRSGERIAVLSGVSPGDRIVTDGVMLLKSN